MTKLPLSITAAYRIGFKNNGQVGSSFVQAQHKLKPFLVVSTCQTQEVSSSYSTLNLSRSKVFSSKSDLLLDCHCSQTKLQNSNKPKQGCKFNRRRFSSFLNNFNQRNCPRQRKENMLSSRSSATGNFHLNMDEGNKRPSSDMAKFRECFGKAKHIVVLTGAGVSAESGVPTFRGAGGFWRKWQAQDLASPEAFCDNPSLVWEFYHYRREVMASKNPNPAHMAIAQCEKRLKSLGRRVVVITQNIDELHKRAGTENILELHGSLFKTRCTKCGTIRPNRDSPICAALAGKGEPNPDAQDAKIPGEQLPRCNQRNCGGLLRPHVVWFGESLDPEVLHQTRKELDACDLCLVVGTSSVVYPAAMFAPSVAARGVPVAEFNIEDTPATSSFGFMFQGPAGENLPGALAPHDYEQK